MSEAIVFPYTFDERKPVFLNPALIVPEYYTDSESQKHKDFFSSEWEDVLKKQEVIVEYCAGNGQWIIDKALKNPHITWIAVEKRFDRVKKIYKWIKRHKLNNCFVAFGKAEDFASYYLKNETCSHVYVNFPDPWPKLRHAKNRLFKEKFLSDVKQSLKPKGKLILATDEFAFLQESIEAMKQAGFIPEIVEPFYEILSEDYGASFFENLWASKGKTNYITTFIKP